MVNMEVRKYTNRLLNIAAPDFFIFLNASKETKQRKKDWIHLCILACGLLYRVREILPRVNSRETSKAVTRFSLLGWLVEKFITRQSRASNSHVI